MAFGDQALLHGAALFQLLAEGTTLVLRRPDSAESIYELSIDGQASRILFKHSTAAKRWQFMFSDRELELLLEAGGRTTWAALVCKRDGVCCLSSKEIERLLATPGDVDARFVAVWRPRGGSYRVRGPAHTDLGYTVPLNDWPRRLFGELE